MINFDCSYQFIYHEYNCNKTPLDSVMKIYKDKEPHIIFDVIENFRPNACLICLFDIHDKHNKNNKDSKDSIKILEKEIKLENIKRIKFNSQRLHYNVMLKNQNKILIDLLDKTHSDRKLEFLVKF